MTRMEFMESMALLIAVRGREMPDAQLDGFYEFLKDLSPGRFREAVVAFIQTGDDWPSVSKLRKLAKQIGINKAMYPTARRIEGRKLPGPVSEAVRRIGSVNATDVDSVEVVIDNKTAEQQAAELRMRFDLEKTEAV